MRGHLLVLIFCHSFRGKSSDNDDEVLAVADKLRAPMSQQSEQLKREFVDIFIPGVKRVKEVHDTLENMVDYEFGEGILMFDDACKKMEHMAIQEEDDLKNIHNVTQVACIHDSPVPVC